MKTNDQVAGEARLAIAAEIKRKADPLGARNFATFCFRREEWLMIAAAIRALPLTPADDDGAGR